VLRALADEATRRGDRGIELHAQRTARDFYARLGFEPQGAPYGEAGIPHINMTSALPLAR
jgi:predicted GNAT family N-acyltransferase